MDTTRATRPIPLFLTALVAFFSALAALGATNGHDAHAPAPPHITRRRPQRDAEGGRSARVDAAPLGGPHHVDPPGRHQPHDGRSGHRRTVGRLLQNQTDIGDAIKPFYGDEAGNELTRQLKQHILIAADVIAAAKAGDAAALAAAQAQWAANGDDIQRHQRPQPARGSSTR